MSLWKKKPKRQPKVIPPKSKSITPPSNVLIERKICGRPIPCWRCDQYISGVEDGRNGRNCKSGMYKDPSIRQNLKIPKLVPKIQVPRPIAPAPVLALPEPEKEEIATQQKETIRPPSSLYNPEREFLRIFKKLTYAHSPWSVWQDFVTMFACTISNAVDKSHYEKREQLYLKIIEKYAKSDQQLFPQLVAETIMALDSNQEQDFLGKLYMTLELQNDRKSQYFTPYSVCKCMAEIALGDVMPQIKERGYISIHDPCCGAGATLIAGIHTAKSQLEKSGLNFQNHILIVGQDIDSTVALMCYIQISLLGMAGYIKIGNSLTEPMISGDLLDNYWYTPMYFSDVWTMRRILKQMDSILGGKEQADEQIQSDIHAEGDARKS